MRIETWYFKQNAMSFFIGLMPVGKYVEYNHHPNFACECDVTCKDYFYLSSTSLPGGNQVGGLPPVFSRVTQLVGKEETKSASQQIGDIDFIICDFHEN